MISGSRSSVVSVIEFGIIAILAVYGVIRVKKKYLFAGMLISPVFLLILFFSYTISTLNRQHVRQKHMAGISQSIDSAKKVLSNSQEVFNVGDFLPRIAGRIGFFDFSAEIIAHSEKYESVFNISYYSKSFVDNILSPGFDVFNLPRVANALIFIYRDRGKPRKSVVSDNYQSDQVGIHGELYALFGYSSLVLFFGGAVFIKKVYKQCKASNPLILALHRALILVVFFQFIRSFGIDWLILNTIVLVVSITIMQLFFRIIRIRYLNPHQSDVLS